MNDIPNTQFGDDPVKILYVDDEEKALKYFSMAFGHNYSILTATSVAEAQAILSEHNHEIALLITDQRMPGETGVELLDYVRHEYPHMIRILTTAYADLDDAIAAVNRGEIFRYVTKPWNIESFATELAQASEFFHLRNERDLLLREKMSLRKRQAQMNRARDLIVMAASLPNLRHTQQAIYAYLDQFIRDLKMADSEPNHWQNEEHEIQRSVDIATVTRSLASICEGRFESSTTAPEMLNQFSQLSVADSTNTTSVKVDSDSIKKMIISIITAMEGDNDALVANIKSDNDICIHLSRSGDAHSENKHLDAWLSAYLIAYHHSGSIRIETEPNRLTCIICIPVNPLGTTLPPVADFALDEIFSQLEEVG